MPGSLFCKSGMGSDFLGPFDLFVEIDCFGSSVLTSMSDAKLKPSSLKQF
jgi:hypothetical protein